MTRKFNQKLEDFFIKPKQTQLQKPFSDQCGPVPHSPLGNSEGFPCSRTITDDGIKKAANPGVYAS